MSSLTTEQLRAWRLFFETSVALMDILDSDDEAFAGVPVQWYDVLVHLEETPDGLRMNELADKILYSKSGLTRVIDRMEKAGLVSRHRPENDRRSIFVRQTTAGHKVMLDSRTRHHEWIDDNFVGLLGDADIKALTRIFEKLSAHARTRRPGRISG